MFDLSLLPLFLFASSYCSLDAFAASSSHRPFALLYAFSYWIIAFLRSTSSSQPGLQSRPWDWLCNETSKRRRKAKEGQRRLHIHHFYVTWKRKCSKLNNIDNFSIAWRQQLFFDWLSFFLMFFSTYKTHVCCWLCKGKKSRLGFVVTATVSCSISELNRTWKMMAEKSDEASERSEWMDRSVYDKLKPFERASLTLLSMHTTSKTLGRLICCYAIT